MASGVQPSDDCVKVFQALKLQKRLKYIIYTLNDSKTEIVVEKTSEESDYDTFMNDLPGDQCRWAVYDFAFEKDGNPRNKLCFISWSPDTAPIKQKMVSASSRDALRRRLDGIAVEIQGTDSTEVSYEAVLAKASAGAR